MLYYEIALLAIIGVAIIIRRYDKWRLKRVFKDEFSRASKTTIECNFLQLDWLQDKIVKKSAKITIWRRVYDPAIAIIKVSGIADCHILRLRQDYLNDYKIIRKAINYFSDGSHAQFIGIESFKKENEIMPEWAEKNAFSNFRKKIGSHKPYLIEGTIDWAGVCEVELAVVFKNSLDLDQKNGDVKAYLHIDCKDSQWGITVIGQIKRYFNQVNIDSAHITSRSLRAEAIPEGFQAVHELAEKVTLKSELAIKEQANG